MIILLIIAGLIFCGVSVYFFYKANYCACTRAGQCDNPVNQYWLAAIATALTSLGFCCSALHVELGTLLWLTLMGNCFLGGFISVKANKKRRCKNTKEANALLKVEAN
ncbi:hypothetical protein [Pseudoalteromonas sp.]|uniref:hypothetical protein n=1 Tax=Pseudoalteromonas sp. TaxID=53249 RepID=UPI001BCDA44B